MSFAHGAEVRVVRSVLRYSVAFEGLVHERGGVEVISSVPRDQPVVVRCPNFPPKRFFGGSTGAFAFEFPFHEVGTEIVHSEFVAARHRVGRNESFQVFRNGRPKDRLYGFQRFSDNVLRRSPPTRMDQGREVDFGITVRETDDGAIGGGEENAHVPVERLFRDDDYGIAVSAVRFRSGAVEEIHRILTRRVLPSGFFRFADPDDFDQVGMFGRIRKKDLPLKEVAMNLNDRAHSFANEFQSFVRAFPYRTRRFRHARERRPSAFGNGFQHGVSR